MVQALKGIFISLSLVGVLADTTVEEVGESSESNLSLKP